jgi:ABC-type branched-subunit amino acid transport system permease subunit
VLVERTGMNPRAVRRVAWLFGAGSAAIAGVLLAPHVGLEPVVLSFLVVQSFGAAAIGRFRSMVGTYFGALAIGVGGSLAAAYVSAPALRSLPTAVPYLVLVAVLVLAPPSVLRERIARGARLARPAAPAGRTAAAAVLGVTVAFAVPQLFPTRLPLATSAAASVVVFLGLSLVTNLAGHLSLCHAALAALGATTFSSLTAVAPWGVALVGGAVAVIPLALAISAVAARVSELALGIATFGLANLLVVAGYSTMWMFGGDGTRRAPRPSAFASDSRYFVLVALVALACCVVVAALNASRAGRIFRALAVAPDTLEALGVSATATRAAVFTLGGLFAGLGGALSAAGNLSASSAGFPATLSLLWVAALAFGGRGVVSGAVRAGVAVVFVPFFLDPVAGGHTTWLFGAVAVAVSIIGTARMRQVAA